MISFILFAGMLMQAQQKISDVQYMNLHTYVSESDSLYNGHNYEYYNNIYRKANTLKVTGMVFTFLGIGLGTTGAILTGTDLNKGAPMFLTGFIIANFGAPLWIAGGMKRKNNRKAMEQIKRNPNISFRTTETGIGLVLNF
jgi:hypothetical protein